MIWPRQFCRLETMRMAHVNCKFLHLAFKIVSSALFLFFHLNDQKIRNYKFQTNNERFNTYKILRTRLQYDINAQQEREKKRQAVVFVSSFLPRGGVFCCSWRDGAGFFFSRRDGAVVVFFRGGTGRVFFFSEAGRGGCFIFRGGTGWLFFFFSTGRDGAVFFFFFRGPGRDGCFWRWHFFWRDGAKSLHRPAKGGLNRPTSRPCKALVFIDTAPPSACTARFGVLWQQIIRQ